MVADESICRSATLKEATQTDSVSDYKGEIMPSVSADQQQAMAIAEHDPDKLYPRNRGLLKMSHKQLHDFASTPRKGLPAKAPKAKRHKVSYPSP